MKEKAKRESGFATFGLRQGFRTIMITTGFMIVLMAGGFFSCGYLATPADSYLTWSPDSRYLALQRQRRDLYIYDLVEQSETRHPNRTVFMSTRAFYNNHHLFMGGNEVREFMIYNVDTQQVLRSIKLENMPTWSVERPFTLNLLRDSIVYAYAPVLWEYSDPQNKDREPPMHDLWEIDLTTYKVTQLTDTSDQDETSPQYAQDGSFLVAGDSLLKDGIWTKIPNFMAEDGRYSISSDGQWILTYQEEADGLYLLPIDGSSEPQFVQKGPFEEIAWSPNGCYIAYSQAEPPRFAIVLASDWGLGQFVEPDADCKPYPTPSIFG